MSKKDYYEILGVDKSSTDAEIKKAYRKLALKYHPDKSAADKKKEYEEKFKELSDAYRVLSDKDKKAQYDQYGHAFSGQGAGQGGFSQQDFSHFYDAFGSQDSFEDLGFGRIFEQMFGFRSQARGRSAAQGHDIQVDLEITLEEAFSGFKKEIELNKLASCSECHGKGGHDLKKCNICKGGGIVQERVQSILGTIVRQRVCTDCQGQGEKPDKKCIKCQGQGRVKEIGKIEVTVPAGISSEQSLRLSGQGEAAPHGGSAGDLYVAIHVKEHKYFKRYGDDLLFILPIDFTQAALGDKIEIPSVESKILLKIPSGTQPNSEIKLKGKGMPRLAGHSRGDMIVRIQVNVPKHLSAKQKKLIEELSTTNNQNAFSKFFS